eukprot:gnl/Chilomastix_caulleri/4259.p1 GENE.gnl/Chilomastix_caulleri/4259~~gnl/Chilomastix_caulleri/4259.p1  ORF type:complete len:88 (+),score=10.06 gnl/Chilomastix_caulleri/4259:1-264(+)
MEHTSRPSNTNGAMTHPPSFEEWRKQKRGIVDDALSATYASLLGRPSSIVYSAAAMEIHPSRARLMMQEHLGRYRKPLPEWSGADVE